MGWTCRITSDKPISKNELQEILKEAPAQLQHPWLGDLGLSQEQEWGWVMATDVMIDEREANTIKISGSYSISGHKAETMRAYLKKSLKKRGHLVRSTKPQ